MFDGLQLRKRVSPSSTLLNQPGRRAADPVGFATGPQVLEAAVYKHKHLLYDRHLDVVVVCAVFITCKVHQLQVWIRS